MSHPSRSRPRTKARRHHVTHIACEPCREKRAKCDGKETCSRCVSRGLTCVYTERNWASKETLRDQVEDYTELIRRRDRILDAISDHTVGDHVLEHLKQHGIEDTYDNLPRLTAANPTDNTLTNDTLAIASQSGVYSAPASHEAVSKHAMHNQVPDLAWPSATISSSEASNTFCDNSPSTHSNHDPPPLPLMNPWQNFNSPSYNDLAMVDPWGGSEAPQPLDQFGSTSSFVPAAESTHWPILDLQHPVTLGMADNGLKTTGGQEEHA